MIRNELEQLFGVPKSIAEAESRSRQLLTELGRVNADLSILGPGHRRRDLIRTKVEKESERRYLEEWVKAVRRQVDAAAIGGDLNNPKSFAVVGFQALRSIALRGIEMTDEERKALKVLGDYLRH